VSVCVRKRDEDSGLGYISVDIMLQPGLILSQRHPSMPMDVSLTNTIRIGEANSNL